MEYIMELGAGRELQPVCDVPNFLKDEEWSVEFWSQFATAFDVE
jgi:hypothetical protein